MTGLEVYSQEIEDVPRDGILFRLRPFDHGFVETFADLELNAVMRIVEAHTSEIDRSRRELSLKATSTNDLLRVLKPPIQEILYALQITYWSDNISGELNITIWRFSEQISQAVIQTIEDGLGEKYKPMFGRRGAR